MPHQDQGRSTRGPAIAPALDWLVAPQLFGRLSFRKGCSWTPQALVQAALAWAWGEETALTDRYFTARQTIAQREDGQRELVSYQAFVKLLKRHSALLLLALVEALQRRMREALAESYRVAGYLAFGVDGTRIDAPRTLPNEQAFGGARCRTRRRGRRRRAARKKVAAPRIWLTTLWHLGSGLPWGWTHGPSDSCERGHLLAMLAWLPERSLLTADAGFVGYEFWQALQAAGHDFLIRVGANVTLLKQLGCFRECAGRVYLWPDKQARKRRPPIVLRLVVAHEGKHPVYLVSERLGENGALGSAAHRVVPGAVGRGSLLPQLQADLRPAQAPLCVAGQRDCGTRLVARGAVGGLPVRQGSTTSGRRGPGQDQRRRRASHSAPRPPRAGADHRPLARRRPGRFLSSRMQGQPRLSQKENRRSRNVPAQNSEGAQGSSHARPGNQKVNGVGCHRPGWPGYMDARSSLANSSLPALLISRTGAQSFL